MGGTCIWHKKGVLKKNISRKNTWHRARWLAEQHLWLFPAGTSLSCWTRRRLTFSLVTTEAQDLLHFVSIHKAFVRCLVQQPGQLLQKITCNQVAKFPNLCVMVVLEWKMFEIHLIQSGTSFIQILFSPADSCVITTFQNIQVLFGSVEKETVFFLCSVRILFNNQFCGHFKHFQLTSCLDSVYLPEPGSARCSGSSIGWRCLSGWPQCHSGVHQSDSQPALVLDPRTFVICLSCSFQVDPEAILLHTLNKINVLRTIN